MIREIYCKHLLFKQDQLQNNLHQSFSYALDNYIKTHGRVSKAKKIMRHTRSRHTVMCQQPRKPCGAQACYLQEPLTRHFIFLYLYNHWADF